MKSIILIGGGGHCVACIDVLEQLAEYTIGGILDLPEKRGNTVLGYPINGDDGNLTELSKQAFSFLVTVGQVKSVTLRKALFERVQQAGGMLPTIVSPRAYVSPHAEIGDGTIVMHGAVINAGVRIGRNCIINTRAVIEHEVTIGDHCHVSTGVAVNGQAEIGTKAFIGSQAMVSNNVKICSDAVVGAGTLVLKDITEGKVWFGRVD